MTTNRKFGAMELSYFRLSLLSYLKDSHPHLANNAGFIKERGDEAAEVYSAAIKLGLSHIEAEAEASEALFKGLNFSVYNTLIHILWNEFREEIPEEEAEETALKLLPLCDKVIRQYELTDDFAESFSYDLLYTELTGTIQDLLKNGL